MAVAAFDDQNHGVPRVAENLHCSGIVDVLQGDAVDGNNAVVNSVEITVSGLSLIPRLI